MTNNQAKIAYLLKAFPRTSETFITNEIYLLEQAGVALSIYSFKQLQGQQQHAVVNKIKAPVYYLPETTPSEESGLQDWLRLNWPFFSRSHHRLFRMRPVNYLRTLFRTILMGFKYRTEQKSFFNRTFIKEFLQAGEIADNILQDPSIRHLHAHFAHTTTTVTMLAGSLCGLPFSFTAHAKDIYAAGMNPGDLLSVKMRKAKFIVTCTQANHEYLSKLNFSGTPLHTIYHGLDLSLFVPTAPHSNGTSSPALILAVGRMVEKKGFPYLVEACARLKNKGYDFRCRIVGGEDKDTPVIKNLIEKLNLSEIVSLHGAVTQEELRSLYEQATMFVLPCQVIDNGDRDGIPNVLVEAMAMELPVISTEISGIPELIDQRKNGLMVPPKNVATLTDAMEEYLNSPELRTRLGIAAREKVCDQFDSSHNIQRLKNIFIDNLEKK